MKLSRSIFARAGLAAVVLAAAGTASVAQAGDHVYFSIGANVAPGVVVNAGNAPPPVYVAPAPVYVAPAPVYYEAPAPVYYEAPAYYAPAPVVGVSWVWSRETGRYYYMDHHGRRHWDEGRHRPHFDRHGERGERGEHGDHHRR
jgi:hypothetical protein